MEMGLTQADAAKSLNLCDSIVQRLWDQFQSGNSVSRKLVPGRERVTTPSEIRLAPLRTRRRRPTTVPQLVSDNFVSTWPRITLTKVIRRLHNQELYAKYNLCVPLFSIEKSPFSLDKTAYKWNIWQWAS
ncbi:hypothetical protein AVEN_155458-1 [Araneus ventricosus]|uniref:Paired domain-containing protein n=1 Tax=Araneus ventricosus TaxID=182803 RepID=A0A4Y2NGP6_ARAVE|nr:hypothetical protein AVEN_155458-1 [Araneus ventricosus]